MIGNRAVYWLGAASLLLLLAAAPAPAWAIESKPGAAAKCRADIVLPPPRTREAPDAVKVLPPEQGAYAGLFSIGTTVADDAEFERKTGKRPAIVYTFHDWISDEDFAHSNPTLRTFADPLEDKSVTPLALAEQLAKEGRILAVAWAIQCCDFGSRLWWLGLRKTAVSTPRVLRGEHDAYIRTVARQIKAFGKPIMISPYSEFNMQGVFSFGRDGDEALVDADDLCGAYGDPGWPDGPERVRDTYRRIVDIFREEGVTNVTWFMYAASRYMDPTHDDYNEWLHPRYFYPGDDYIDWVGQSAYFVDPAWNFEVNEDGGPIELALGRGYDAWGSVTSRPMFLAEFGALGTPETNRAAVIGQVMTNDLPKRPRVKAFALADFLIGEICCQVPRLGRGSPDEIKVWRATVTENAHYVFNPRTGRRQ